MQFRNSLFPATAVLVLAACNAQPAEETAPPDAGESEATAPSATPTPTESVSILRVENAPSGEEANDMPLEPLEVVIGFPEGGSALNKEAVSRLEGVLASKQLALGQPITLSAHSDSQGTDAANLKSSEKRGLAVAKWLTDKGVDPDRITVIAFGEQNPVAPNAKDDGTPNEEGRAANRRVEVTVPTLSLTVSTTDEAGLVQDSTEVGD